MKTQPQSHGAKISKRVSKTRTPTPTVVDRQNSFVLHANKIFAVARGNKLEPGHV